MKFKFKKKYGQNFLTDKNIVKKIVNLIDEKNDSLVIEIGCGDGRLTKELCSSYDNVLGYEIDTELEKDLFSNLSDYSNYKIVFCDFLQRNIIKDLTPYNYFKLYIVANLPYYITTPIIEKVIKDNLKLDKMILMVQKEVGERFSAKPNSKEYGSLTVYLNYYFNIKKEFLVNRNSFIPIPNVDSVVVSFTRKKELIKLKSQELFFKLVRDSFKYKRKNLRNNLKDYDLVKIEEILKKYNMDLNIRAESITVEVFAEISNNL